MNTVRGQMNVVTGGDNTVEGGENKVVGTNNIIRGSGNVVTDAMQTVGGEKRLPDWVRERVNKLTQQQGDDDG